MLVSTSQYERYGLDKSDKMLEARLEAVESFIRRYTNNGFQVRAARFEASSQGGSLMGACSLMSAGDTVQVTCSGVNDGLYCVMSAKDGVTRLDKALADAPLNRVTLVRYPPDVVMGYGE